MESTLAPVQHRDVFDRLLEASQRVGVPVLFSIGLIYVLYALGSPIVEVHVAMLNDLRREVARVSPILERIEHRLK